MSYYDRTKEEEEQIKQAGIDYDLDACLNYNPQGFEVFDIKKVLAVIEGENDGPSWHWVLLMTDKRYIYLTGGCDYTGWDCQSSASHVVLGEDKPLYKAVEELGYTWDDAIGITRQLQAQLDTKKSETWQEQKDKEFGL